MIEIREYNSKEPISNDSPRTRAGQSPSMISHLSGNSGVVPLDLKKLSLGEFKHKKYVPPNSRIKLRPIKQEKVSRNTMTTINKSANTNFATPTVRSNFQSMNQATMLTINRTSLLTGSNNNIYTEYSSRVQNQITVQERNIIKKLSLKIQMDEDLMAKKLKEEFNTIKTGDNFSNQSNLKKLKKLVLTNPYQNIPLSVRFPPIPEKEMEKKFISKLTNSVTFKDNQLKHVSHGCSTVAMKVDHTKENLFNKLLNLKDNNLTLTFKKSIKWKNLKWLLTYKTVYVDLLIDHFKEIQELVNKRKGRLSKAVFNEVLTLINTRHIRKDKQFSDSVFLIFDDDKDGFVNFSEMMVGLIFFRGEYFSTKMNMLLELCNDNNKIEVFEFLRLVRLYIFNKKDIKRLYEIVKGVYNLEECSYVNKKTFYDFIVSNEEIKLIFGRSMENVAEHENYLEDEINNFCRSNLKRSQMDSNHLFSGTCLRDYNVFENLLKITQQCSDDRIKNYKLGLIEHDSSDDEKI